MPSKIRILAIAPYQSMQTLLYNVAQEFPEIDLKVIVGDLKVGLDMTINQLQGNYDIFLSRGGTAKLLQQSLSTPVVEIKVSGYDLLRTLKFANAHYGRCAVVGFPNVIREMEILRELVQYEIDTFPINTTEEAASTLHSLMNRNYQALLCDMVTHTTASKLGMSTFLITSGAESMREAFRSAIFVHRTYQRLQADNQFFRTLLQQQDRQTAVFSEDGKLVYATQPEKHPKLIGQLRSRITSLSDEPKGRIVIQIDGILFTISFRQIHLMDQSYIACFYSADPVGNRNERTGIQYKNLDQVEEDYLHGAFSIVEFPVEINNQLQSAVNSNYPVFLIGEAFVGLDHAAEMLYIGSKYATHPFIEVDCAEMKSKNWSFLLHHHDSPLFSSGNTLYFYNLETLSASQLQTLCTFCRTNNASKQNRLIFSATIVSEAGAAADTQDILAQINCQVITLPPLRSQPQLVSRLIHLYLNLVSANDALTVSTIDPNALQQLCRYSWPQNYRQLTRVLDRVTGMSAQKNISSAIVTESLQQEMFLIRASAQTDTTSTIDLSLTLNEIEHDIVSLVLENYNGNHTKAAASLNISRSTLWRMLKKE